MVLHNSTSGEIILWEKERLLIHRMKDNLTTTDEQYRQDYLALLYLAKAHLPTLFLSSSQDSDFVIVPETQVWCAQKLNEIIGSFKSVQKFAIVPSRSLISQLSTEQNVDEALANRNIMHNQINIQYFSREALALDWLLAGAKY
ncbi:MAG: hypothetical protein MUE85_03510 [Microscillaceae bacterium]|jgi:hypothetical protein|nr:hypothetical protein [Microscillaceae bacterium]